MYYLRFVRNHSQFTPANFDLAKAVKQLSDRGGGRASVFRVSNESEAGRVAVLYAMAHKQGPEQLDYILISEVWLSELGIAVQPEPGDIAHPLLRGTHCELHGLDAGGLCAQLAAKFNSPGGVAKRLGQRIVTEMAKAELDAGPNGQSAALVYGKLRWHERIEELR